jgi:hypothetical protein
MMQTIEVANTDLMVGDVILNRETGEREGQLREPITGEQCKELHWFTISGQRWCFDRTGSASVRRNVSVPVADILTVRETDVQGARRAMLRMSMEALAVLDSVLDLKEWAEDAA